jgi:hypothetical protein
MRLPSKAKTPRIRHAIAKPDRAAGAEEDGTGGGELEFIFSILIVDGAADKPSQTGSGLPFVSGANGRIRSPAR